MRRSLIFIPLFLLLCTTLGCFRQRDRYTLTDSSVDLKNIHQLGSDYGWTSGKLGNYINGHGLPVEHHAFVIVHKSIIGKTRLIWPDVGIGQDSVNAAVLENTIVFTSHLPDGKSVLMASRAGEPPMVITPAVLRLAAKRQGTSLVIPETDYHFTKVQLPTGRIWLRAEEASPNSLNARSFSVELDADDLSNVLDETRQRGKKQKVKKFEYTAEAGGVSHISASEAKDFPTAPSAQATPKSAAIRKGIPYVPQEETLYGDSLLDPQNHYVYCSTRHAPGRILKVAPGNGPKTSPSIIGAAVLEPEEDNTFRGVIDDQGGFAYFGTSFPGHVVKIALGAGNEPPYRVGSILLDPEYPVGVGVVDSGYGVFSSGNKLYKIRLGKADEAPSIISSIALPNNERDCVSAVLDPINHCAFFGCEYRKIYKIALGEGTSPLRLVGELALPTDESGLRGAVIDAKSGYAYFASNSGSLVKISLGGKDNPPERIGALKLDQRFRYFEHTFGMDAAGYAYFGTVSGGNSDAAMVKIALGKNDELPRQVSTLILKPGEDSIVSGIVDPINRILCLGLGFGNSSLAKFSLGEGDAPPTLLSTKPLQ